MLCQHSKFYFFKVMRRWTHILNVTWKPSLFINITVSKSYMDTRWVQLSSIWNSIIRQICGLKRNDEEWKRLHNEELHNLYHSTNMVRVIKSRRLRWSCHVARIEEDSSDFKILTGKPTGKILKYNYIFWLITVVPFKIDLKSFPREENILNLI